MDNEYYNKTNPLMHWLKVWWLKRQAKRHYVRATYLPDHVDCGLHMYHILRPDLAMSVNRFNSIMDQLSALGEDVPTDRLRELS